MITVQPVGEVRAGLGEGPCWDHGTATLLWVDIFGGTVHCTDTSTGSTDTIDLGTPISAALPVAGGGLLAARRNQVVRLDSWTAEASSERLVAGLPEQRAIRFNDGKTDPRGRLLLGTMNTDREPGTAALYRLDGDTLSTVVDGVTVSNGLDWSPDGRTLYYADTPTLRVDALDYDLESGTVSGRRPFVSLEGTPGRPDGLTVDAEGGVWVACVRGGQLRRYAPDGALSEVVPLPVSCPTSCAFGGSRLDELYVTTAAELVPEAERAAEPLAGHLLRLRPGVRGQPREPVRIA